MKMMRNDINDAFCVLMENDDDERASSRFSVVCEGFYIFGFDVNNDYSSRQKILLLKSHPSPCAAAAGLESLAFT